MKKLLLRVLSAAAVSGLLAQAALAQSGTHTIMHPDAETLQRWIAAYNNAPRVVLPRPPRAPSALPTNVSLLSHVNYVPTERDQGICGNCWQWAGTGVMEISLDVQQGIFDRLSVQFPGSCDDVGGCGCSGGWLQDLANEYTYIGYCIPWTNANAHWQNGNGSCNTPCDTIGKAPAYEISYINGTVIPSQGVAQDEAILNIKTILNQYKGVWFAWYLPDASAWSSFYSFWDNQPESAIWQPDLYCGYTYLGGGGHAVLCVGYNDEPGNRYWLMLNSWGTTAQRPNGLFRVAMDMNYGCQNSGLGYAFYWQTLDLVFDNTPGAQTEAPTSVTSTSVTFNARVNPRDFETEYFFEYGGSASYGNRTAGQSAGAGGVFVDVSEDMTSLLPRSSYHYRIVASNSQGIAYGDDVFFMTELSPDAVFEDYFEHGGGTPPGWTQYYVQWPPSLEVDWAYHDGGFFYGNPETPCSGGCNAMFYFEGYKQPRTGLVTPPIDFGTKTNNARLTFWHYMALDTWWLDQDELYVYYRTSATSSWTLLQAYTEDTSTWTQRTIYLPNPGSNYYVSFEAVGNWGYGVALDDIRVLGDDGGGSPPPPGPPAPPELTIRDISRLPGDGVLIRWNTESGERYRVESAGDVDGAWEEEAGEVDGTGGPGSYTDETVLDDEQRFYRVRRLVP